MIQTYYFSLLNDCGQFVNGFIETTGGKDAAYDMLHSTYSKSVIVELMLAHNGPKCR